MWMDLVLEQDVEAFDIVSLPVYKDNVLFAFSIHNKCFSTLQYFLVLLREHQFCELLSLRFSSHGPTDLLLTHPQYHTRMELLPLVLSVEDAIGLHLLPSNVSRSHLATRDRFGGHFSVHHINSNTDFDQNKPLYFTH